MKNTFIATVVASVVATSAFAAPNTPDSFTLNETSGDFSRIEGTISPNQADQSLVDAVGTLHTSLSVLSAARDTVVAPYAPAVSTFESANAIEVAKFEEATRLAAEYYEVSSHIHYGGATLEERAAILAAFNAVDYPTSLDHGAPNRDIVAPYAGSLTDSSTWFGMFWGNDAINTGFDCGMFGSVSAMTECSVAADALTYSISDNQAFFIAYWNAVNAETIVRSTEWTLYNSVIVPTQVQLAADRITDANNTLLIDAYAPFTFVEGARMDETEAKAAFYAQQRVTSDALNAGAVAQGHLDDYWSNALVRTQDWVDNTTRILTEYVEVHMPYVQARRGTFVGSEIDYNRVWNEYLQAMSKKHRATDRLAVVEAKVNELNGIVANRNVAQNALNATVAAHTEAVAATAAAEADFVSTTGLALNDYYGTAFDDAVASAQVVAPRMDAAILFLSGRGYSTN